MQKSDQPYVCTRARIWVYPVRLWMVCRFCPVFRRFTAYNTEDGKIYHRKNNALKTPETRQRRDLKNDGGGGDTPLADGDMMRWQNF